MNILVCNSCNEPMRHDGPLMEWDAMIGGWFLKVLCACGSRMFVTIDLPIDVVPWYAVTIEKALDEVDPFTDTD